MCSSQRSKTRNTKWDELEIVSKVAEKFKSGGKYVASSRATAT